jgi:hypothetical protein
MNTVIDRLYLELANVVSPETKSSRELQLERELSCADALVSDHLRTIMRKDNMLEEMQAQLDERHARIEQLKGVLEMVQVELIRGDFTGTDTYRAVEKAIKA